MPPTGSHPSNDDSIDAEPALKAGRDARNAMANLPADQTILDEPALVADPSLASIIVQADTLCPACGYNRRTQRLGDACPECGHRMATAAFDPAPFEPVGKTNHEEELARHSIFNEPHILSATDAAALTPPDQQVSYANWLRAKIAATSWDKTWGVTLLCLLFGGVWAVLAAMFNNSAVGGSIVIIAVIFAPVIEEVMKVALTAWVVETRPYLFKSKLQIRIAIIASGAMFGLLENIYYVTLILPAANAPQSMYTFRWIVCTSLHIITTIITSIGIARTWSDATTNLREPSLDRAYPWLLAGIVVHGLYNGGAVLFEIGKNLF